MATDPHHQQQAPQPQQQQQQQEQYTSYPEVAPQPQQEHYGVEQQHQPYQYYFPETNKYAPQVQPYQEVAYGSLPQVTPDASNYPQVAYDKTLPEALPPNAYQQHPQQQPYDSQQYNYYQSSPAGDAPQVYEPEQKTLGLKRRTFLIILGIFLALVVIAAVLGGVLGTQLGKDNKKSKDEDIPTTTATSTPTSSPTPTATPIILDTSKLSAINWTDSDSTDYQAVFWQDNQTNLIMSLSDSGGSKWETTNISDIMSSSFSAKAGTHLSAAVRGYPWTSSPFNREFGIALYYIAESGIIEEVYSTDIRGATWKRGSLTTSSANLQAADDSSLAAWWSECADNCTDVTWLFYEDSDGSLMYSGDDDWAAPQFLIRNIVNGAGIAATAIPANSSASPAANSPRIYYHDSNVVQELMYIPGDEPTWYYANTIFRDLPATPPQIAAVSYENPAESELGPVNLLIVANFDNGTLSTNYWNGDNWHDAAVPNMIGKKLTNFTTMSLISGTNLKFFGVTPEGELHVYTVDHDDPLTWTYDKEISLL